MSIEFVSDDNQSRISFQVLGLETRYSSSVEFSVKVSDDSFAGSVIEWFDEKDWNEFIDQLQQCERLRQGSASLVGMDPSWLLRVESCDSIGHFVVHYQIERGRYDYRSNYFRQTLNGVFGLDSSRLAQMIEKFPRFAGLTARIKDSDDV